MGASRKRVFVVDDSQTVRKNLSEILVKDGYEVIEAADGTEALKRLGHERFDLILMDLEMPGLTGFELLRIIEAGNLAKDAPILVITGTHKDLDAVHEIKKLGGAGFIDKSLPPEELLFHVSQCLPK
ncbi:response regulator [Candidatus Manganitrophus noduliformans]|uniref:Response regulator n=1 Tax=Candidatus Manganitrophus noduliformans TaxID=2606439 RepID=A0A7X6DPP2_9BACT|nr:response regulator [Candidatus Manganitrophus noduliformans]NKE70939.1 response regulator [Candidatus Manganitrophus noduliformans]